MLEFYFRFRLLRLRHHWHAILHLPAKFRQNRAIGDRVMTSYPFSKWRPRHRNSASGFVYVIPLIWKGRNLAADQISARNFNARLRYYYLRFFWNKNPPCWNSTPVPTFTFASPSACHSASTYQLSSKSHYPRQTYNLMSIFKMVAKASQFYFRFRFSWVSFVKAEIYLYTKIRQNISIHGWDIATFDFRKQTSAILEFYFRFRFLRLCLYRHVILRLPTKFRPNWTIGDRVMTSYPFFKMRPRHRNSTSSFDFRDFAHLGRSKATGIPNFGEISQSTAEIEILLLPTSENKRPPCFNSTSGSDFYVCVFIGMSFWVCLPNFV